MKLPVLFTKFGRLLPAPRKKEKAEVSCIWLQLYVLQRPRESQDLVSLPKWQPKPRPSGRTPSHVLCRYGSVTFYTGGGEERCDNSLLWENFSCKIFYIFWNSICIKAGFSGAWKSVVRREQWTWQAGNTSDMVYMWRMYWPTLFLFPVTETVFKLS